MARPVVLTWPIPDAQAIAQTQTLAAAGSLTLNGSLASEGNVSFPGFARRVSLTSVNNLAGVNFTVTGTYNGLATSEVLAGPNNNTVQTLTPFEVVTRITANNAAAAVSAGTGTVGRTRWFVRNAYAPVGAMGIQVVVAGAITYSFITTLQEVSGRADAQIATFAPVAALTAQNANGHASFTDPVLYAAISITASGADGSLEAIFLQQGML